MGIMISTDAVASAQFRYNMSIQHCKTRLAMYRKQPPDTPAKCLLEIQLADTVDSANCAWKLWRRVAAAYIGVCAIEGATVACVLAVLCVAATAV